MAALPLPELRPQIERLNNHLHALPTDVATPSDETLRAVRAWEERVAELATIIREFDQIVGNLLTLEAREDPSSELTAMVVEVRARRAEAYALMQRLNPSQAWFWTEEWQAGEREADADHAAGRSTYYDSDEDFLAALHSRRPDADLRGF